ncbi:MAG: ABC transporter substrate-binding protein [Myxococcota bacterium]|nr:ABC transporter substrate-binding protein [Myxococcota bacterium]
MKLSKFETISVFFLLLAMGACSENNVDKKTAKATNASSQSTVTPKATKTKASASAPVIKTDKGVDLASKTIRIGVLNAESGPVAVIGKPFGSGKQILADQINAGQSGLLPEGWKIELVRKDHGYNPSKAQQGFDAIKDDVLFLGLSFGTPTTLPLRPFLGKDNLVAYPASLSSLMASNKHTPPTGPSYVVEASRAMDWVIDSAGGTDKVKAAIVYQQDDYGKDGYKGWVDAAKAHGVAIVAERAVKPGQASMAAEVTALKNAGATHIYMAILPTNSAKLLGTAAAMKFMPTWVGATPSWLDAFFAHPKLPAAVFTNYYWANGLPFWGEKVPGMDKFLAAFKAHGKDARPDFYLLMSYIQALFSIEVAKRAIAAGDLTRAGYLKALQSTKDFTAGGMVPAIDMTSFPYVVSKKTRVLKPDFEKKTWSVVADYAAPKN